VGGQSKIVTVQALRAVAALAVVIRHAGFWEYQFLAGGVDLFFVISGFIMVVSCWPEFGKPCAPERFAVRRIVRIVPLYWLSTLLVMVGAWYTKNVVPETVSVLESLFFYPFATEGPVLPAGWTLNFEMMFYAIFALALVMRPRPAVITASTTLGALVILGWVMGPVSRNNVAFPLSLEFIFGMTIGVAYCAGARVAKIFAAFAIIFGFLAIGLSQKLGLISGGTDPIRVLVWGVPAAFVVAGATLAQWSWRPFVNRPAVLLGDASYALYLFHQPLIMILAGLGYGWSSWPIVIAICIMASISIHFLIERPILGWFRSKPPERSPGMIVCTVWSAR
jgi:exopolysaccharide production protein ExoZ